MKKAVESKENKQVQEPKKKHFMSYSYAEEMFAQTFPQLGKSIKAIHHVFYKPKSILIIYELKNGLGLWTMFNSYTNEGKDKTVRQDICCTLMTSAELKDRLAEMAEANSQK